VQIAEYDSAWPALFERERGLVAGTLGDVAAIEHGGSTAVPGLGGKPIIDMMVAVRDVFDEGQRCVAPLEALGYEHMGEHGMPRRLFFAKPTPRPRSHHLHMVEVGSDFWERHLLFRNYLRGRVDEAEAYYELKVRLAVGFRTDREGYTEAKTRFIEAALVRARAAAR
jgi:GrpB-like predicted nucleotidyltransferase (UPF0157 family)